jgi:hypothetical protein
MEEHEEDTVRLKLEFALLVVLQVVGVAAALATLLWS